MKPPAGLPSAIPQKQHSKLNQVCTCHSREVKSGNTWSTLSSSSSSSCSSSSINRCLALKEKGSVLKWTIKRSNNAYVIRISAHGKQISKRETHTHTHTHTHTQRERQMDGQVKKRAGGIEVEVGVVCVVERHLFGLLRFPDSLTFTGPLPHCFGLGLFLASSWDEGLDV